MKEVVYDGEEEGIYTFPNFLFAHINGVDSSREVRANEVFRDSVFAKAFLPRYDVTVTYEGKIHKTAKVTLEGSPAAVQTFGDILREDNSKLLRLIAAEKEAETSS